MTSVALRKWSAGRADRLQSVHHAVAGSRRGRRWLTAELNQALLLRLASEFQGYCRELHDESIAVMVAAAGGTPSAIQSSLQALLQDGRLLDRRNANWGNICADFSRFGIGLRAEVQRMFPRQYPRWIKTLDALNHARNAIAHGDGPALIECAAQQPLTLATFPTWRSALDGLADGLDRAVGAYLGDAIGVDPW